MALRSHLHVRGDVPLTKNDSTLIDRTLSPKGGRLQFLREGSREPDEDTQTGVYNLARGTLFTVRHRLAHRQDPEFEFDPGEVEETLGLISLVARWVYRAQVVSPGNDAVGKPEVTSVKEETRQSDPS